MATKLFSKEEIDIHCEKWIKIGLATGPTDLDKAKKGIDLAYSAAGLKSPKEILVYQSPLIGIKAAEELAKNSKSVRSQVWDRVWDQVRSQVRSQVWYQVWDQVWYQIWNQVRNQVRNQISFGNHDVHLLAELSILKDIPEVKKLEGLILLAESTGWFLPYEDKIILIDRPSGYIWRDKKCVHIEYSDGFEVSQLSPLERLANCSV